jgi:hypothetical protein
MRERFAFVVVTLSVTVLVSGVAEAASGAGIPPFPSTILSNRVLKAAVYLPDAEKGYYRGTRFDWSGLISRVDCGGHTFFSEFKQEHDPLNHDDTCGTSEEFGIESAPSYAETKPGEPFIKIGIGVLERPDSTDYSFWKRYKILTPGIWKEAFAPGKIEFRQELQGPSGWAYGFMKVLQAKEGAPELQIRRTLKNTGTQRLVTDHYDHNFLRIDDLPAGTNYTLEFPFTPHFGEDSKPEGLVTIQGNSLVFTREPGRDQAIWVRLDGFSKPEDNRIKVINHATGASMTITTDKPLSKLVFYSSGGVLCPEAFVNVDLAAGQTLQWNTTYRFETGGGPKL